VTAPSAAVAELQTVRERECLLCGTLAGQPCQAKPEGDHLARYMDTYTAGQLTKAYMAMVLGELVIIDTCVVVTARGEDGSR
jgi:hypothetical protein